MIFAFCCFFVVLVPDAGLCLFYLCFYFSLSDACNFVIITNVFYLLLAGLVCVRICVGCRYIGRFFLIVKKCLMDTVFCENL